MPEETTFQMPGENGSREETGIVTWTVPYHVPDEDAIFTVGEDPPLIGLTETNRNWNDIEGAGYQVNVTFEGYVGEDIESESAIYEYDSSFGEETLAAHPNWSVMKEFYGGSVDAESGRVTFTETLDKVPKELELGLRLFNNEEGGIKNPLFGAETFLVFNTIFRKTYISEEIDEDLLSLVGTTIDELPEGFPTPSGRNWLITPPRIRQRGDFFEITEELILSPVGGTWPDTIYQLIEF